MLAVCPAHRNMRPGRIHLTLHYFVRDGLIDALSSHCQTSKAVPTFFGSTLEGRAYDRLNVSVVG